MDTTFAVQCPPFKLQLSHWDKRMGPLYSQRILCFPLSNNSDEHKAHITQLLLTALQSTVEKLPFLAGSVVKDKPWLYNLRPKGAAYLEVKNLSSTVIFQDLRKALFAPTLLDNKQLCLFPNLSTSEITRLMYAAYELISLKGAFCWWYPSSIPSLMGAVLQMS